MLIIAMFNVSSPDKLSYLFLVKLLNRGVMEKNNIEIKNLVVFTKKVDKASAETKRQKFLLTIRLFVYSSIAFRRLLNESLESNGLIERVSQKISKSEFKTIDECYESLCEKLFEEIKELESIEIEINKPWMDFAVDIDQVSIKVKKSKELSYILLYGEGGDMEHILNLIIYEINQTSQVNVSSLKSGDDNGGNVVRRVLEIETLYNQTVLQNNLNNIIEKYRTKYIKSVDDYLNYNVILCGVDTTTRASDKIISNRQLNADQELVNMILDINPAIEDIKVNPGMW